MLSLIIGISVFAIPSGLTDDELFSHFLPEAIALLQQGSTIINHFGLVPDNGSDEIDDLLVDGVLFRFDVPQIILGILQDTEPLAVKQAFLTLIENKYLFIVSYWKNKETLKMKKQSYLILADYNLTAIKSAE